jgi:hypothetical protein
VSFGEQLGAFESEEAQLRLDAPGRGESRHAPVRANETVAWNEERPGILSKRGADGPRRYDRLTDRHGELTVAPGLARLHAQRRLVNRALK